MKCPKCGNEAMHADYGDYLFWWCGTCELIITEHQQAEIAKNKNIAQTVFYKVEQILGKALGYPWYKDDQVNFPGATEEDGVCVGEHIAETIAAEAAHKIDKLRSLLKRLEWAGRVYARDGQWVPCCLVCQWSDGHAPDCELKAAIGEKG